MDNPYLEGLLKEINLAQEEGRKGIFRINDKVNDEAALLAKDYIEKKFPNYKTEFRKCFSCSGWDILIYF